MGHFDVIVEKIGPFGHYQITYWLLCGIGMMPAGLQHVANVFLEAIPDHWCHVPGLTNHSSVTLGNHGNQTDTAADELGQYGDKSCFIKDISDNGTSDGLISVKYSIVACTEWDYDYSTYGSTAVTKWDLVCTKAVYPSIAQTLYMVGVVIGALFFGHLSDSIGRKISLCISINGVVVFGLLSAAMPEFWSHSILRLFVGICAIGCISIAYVLAVELIGINQRIIPGLSMHPFFVLGTMVLSLVAYCIKDFIWTNLVVSLLPLLLLPYICILPESPRWLLEQGRLTEAKAELTRAAKMNRIQVNVDELVEEYVEANQKESETQKHRHYNVIDLFRTPKIRKTCLNISYAWFSSSILYYMMIFAFPELVGNAYLNLVVLGLLESLVIIPLYLACQKLGRRPCLAVVSITGGLSCLISLALPNFPVVYKTILVLSRMCGSSAIAMAFLYTAELFPTVLRTIALGTGSTLGHIGSMIGPIVTELGRIWWPLPLLIVGIISLTSGLLNLLLPETRGQRLPDTIEEAEKHQMYGSCSPCTTGDSTPSEGDALLGDSTPHSSSNSVNVLNSR